MNAIAGMDDFQLSSEDKIKDAHKKLVMRFAYSLAKLDDELENFNLGKSYSASQEQKDFLQEYLDEAHDILDGTGIIEPLCLTISLMDRSLSCIIPNMDMDEVEGFIAKKTEDARRIEEQLRSWDEGVLTYRDENWAERAKIALKKASHDIVFAHKLRLKIARKSLFEEVISGRERQISDLKAHIQRERERHLSLRKIERDKNLAMISYIEEHAPHLLDGMKKASFEVTRESSSEE